MTSLLDAALAYAERGWYVFPCAPLSKIPFPGSAGSKDATLDPDQIRRWWSANPTANVAIVTGSRSGIYVIDVDAPASEDLARLSPTVQARTPAGGWHYYYSLPAGEPLKNFVKPAKPGAAVIVGKHTDGRGEGGYVLAWPSVVDKNGKSGGYSWLNLDAIDIAPMPQWITDKLRTQHRPPDRTAYLLPPSVGYGAKALAEEAALLAATSEGGRNDALNKASFRLAQLVASGHLSQSSVEEAMLSAARACGLPEHEAQRTIRSGVQAGMQHPRSPLPRHQRDRHLEPEVLDAETELEVDLGVSQLSSHDSEDRSQWALLGKVRALGGLCDSFCGWVIRGADHPQPGLTMAACVALGSVLAARRFKFRGARSSLYVASIAGSGDGKNRPQLCVRRLLSELWSHLNGPTSFVSSAALQDTVRDATDIGVGTMLVLDEYGMHLKEFIGGHSSGPRADIKRILTEIATIGDGVWRPAKSRALGGGAEIVVAPSLSLLGSTTPESLHAIITHQEFADGYAGRHLWFAAQHTLPMWQPPESRGDDSIPSEVRLAVERIRSMHEEWHENLPKDGTSENGLRIVLRHEPLEMDAEPAAVERLTAYKFEVDDVKRSGKEGDVPRSILGRSPEYATRIAMGLAVMAKPELEVPVVTTEIVEVAIALAMVSNDVIAASIRANKKPSRDDPSTHVDYVLEKLRMCAGSGNIVSKRELLRKAQMMTAKQIDDVLHRLHEEGRIQLATEETGGRPRMLIKMS